MISSKARVMGPLAQHRSGSRTVGINSILQAGADALGKVGLLVLYAVMARAAGQSAFGDFASAASLAVFVTVVSLAPDFRVTRLVARGDESAGDAWRSALALKLLLGSLIFVLAVAVAVAGGYHERVVVSTVVLGGAMMVELVMSTVHAVFRGMENLRPVASALALYRVTLAVIGVAVLLVGASIVVVCVGWLVASLLGLAYSVAHLRSAGLVLPGKLSASEVRASMGHSSGLLVAAALGALLSRLDIVLLGLLKDSGEVALYGGAYRMVESTLFITTAVALASFPALSRLDRNSSPTIGEASSVATKVVLIITVPIALLFGLYAEPLVEVVYGSALEEAGTALQWLALVVVLAGLTGLISFVLTAQERQWVIVACLGTSTAANVVLDLLLIPPHGATGAAIAMALSMLLCAVLFALALARAAGRPPAMRILAAPGAGAVAMAGVALSLGGSVLGAVPAALAFLLVVVLVERGLHPEDATRIRRMLRRRPVMS